MGDRPYNVIRRAASVAVVAGSVAVGTAAAATSANADNSGRTEASVLVNVTPDGTGEPGPYSQNVGCRTAPDDAR